MDQCKAYFPFSFLLHVRAYRHSLVLYHHHRLVLLIHALPQCAWSSRHAVDKAWSQDLDGYTHAFRTRNRRQSTDGSVPSAKQSVQDFNAAGFSDWSLTCTTSLLAGWLANDTASNIWPRLEARRAKQCKITIGVQDASDRRPRPSTWDRIGNNSVAQDPRVCAPAKVMLPAYLLVFAYSGSRTLSFSLDFMELRSLSAFCFDIPRWQQFIPYLGK